ncbi:hypothetical protein MRB53_022334 [Persea americana]|uniref:Uncharacterized protein n=1 Tax=Persea americana TaxID=3435 RepID=A0ACC2L6I3_PERAE|nr:hypothetical protein MRB53_022334 [Persea americana]
MADIIISSCAKTLTPITKKSSWSPPLPSKPHHPHQISIPNIKNKVLGSIRSVAASRTTSRASSWTRGTPSSRRSWEKNLKREPSAMSSHHAHASSASDPRQPSTAKPYIPPTIAPQDLPIDYSGFIAIVFGITGVMLREDLTGRNKQKKSQIDIQRRSLIETIPVNGCFVV